MLRVAGQSASFSPRCIGSAAERKIRLCSRTAASTPSMCCWRAGEMRARRPCSVLLSESASSTPCGDCCDRQAVLEAVGRWWASCVLLGQMCGRTARRTSTGACWRRLRCWRTGCDAGGLAACELAAALWASPEPQELGRLAFLSEIVRVCVVPRSSFSTQRSRLKFVFN